MKLDLTAFSVAVKDLPPVGRGRVHDTRWDGLIASIRESLGPGTFFVSLDKLNALCDAVKAPHFEGLSQALGRLRGGEKWPTGLRVSIRGSKTQSPVLGIRKM